MLELIFYSLIGGVFSLVGGFLLLWKQSFTKKIMTPLLSFAAGAFLAAAFLDILPEAIELVAEPHLILVTTLLGIVTFFVLERMLMTFFYKHKDITEAHSDHTESLPLLLILGDSFHNFLDGIVIALSFVANPSLGLITTLAVAAHEIPQEIGDFGVLLNQGWSKKKVILVNIVQSLFTLPGALLGYYTGNSLEHLLPYSLAAAAGIFIYLACSDVIPEIHHRSGHKQFYKVVLPLVASIIIIGYLVNLTH
ncbi:MAG: ZIP family metal transporter [Patescibacteria group bacterium]